MVAVFEDRQARRRILWGTLGLATLGGAIGLNYSILKHLQPIPRHTLTMAANWATFGLVFFSIRESLLVEQQAKNKPLDLRFSITRDHDEMFSSITSGFVTGATLSFITRRTKNAAVTGALFFSVMAGVGQFAYTKINRKRQRVILDKMESSETPRVLDLVRSDESTSLVARLRRKMVDPVTLLPEWFPLKRLSSEEYRAMLTVRKDELVLEVAQLRASIADMNRREDTMLARLREIEAQKSQGA
ncbi:hypothetical protein GGI25_003538 [Coemansia spiralis]|uniref:Uncharacterized protein n=2 Tax=Coemansia TaxID=4863 RepID=A0A9W8KWG2_9FUNG|nr:hypothetical protein BX070DRAFT_19520 [Coemansia spiralis]KAJ1990428.1 hypothetical protein EDC05_004072 [Coemansia umbellata]KAJ2622085.1 hypothetical protein GGI26_003527 [Coemansia sp. RSA 1358]KAJ2676503.1 hypothetical protein GGI25_003538 [Coemansia spiralis]